MNAQTLRSGEHESRVYKLTVRDPNPVFLQQWVQEGFRKASSCAPRPWCSPTVVLPDRVLPSRAEPPEGLQPKLECDDLVLGHTIICSKLCK